MLESLFGNPVIEKVLFFLLLNQKCYPSQLKTVFNVPLYSFQKALARLEKGSILISYPQGKMLFYEFNPRYPLLKALKEFLQKVYECFPEDFREKYYEPTTRRRPRRQGKPL